MNLEEHLQRLVQYLLLAMLKTSHLIHKCAFLQHQRLLLILLAGNGYDVGSEET